MNTSSSNFVRECNADDKAAVLQIDVDDAYVGLDYLPEYFDYFQNSRHTTPYVFVKNDKIIAYVACSLVDNGYTIVTRAGRVCAEQRGNHVYKRLLYEIETIQHVDDLNETIKHLALLKSITPSESFLKAYTPVAAKTIHTYEYRRNNVVDKLYALTAVNRCEAKQVDNIPVDYLSPPYSNYLFPEGRIIVDWVSFRPLSANIPLFRGKNTVFISDVLSDLESIAHQDASEVNRQLETAHTELSPIHIRGMLSASTLINTKHDVDLVCNLDIFGTDIRSLRDHVYFHLQRIADTDEDTIVLVIFTTKACESSLLDEIMGQIGVQKLTDGTRKAQYLELTVYEKSTI